MGDERCYEIMDYVPESELRACTLAGIRRALTSRGYQPPPDAGCEHGDIWTAPGRSMYVSPRELDFHWIVHVVQRLSVRERRGPRETLADLQMHSKIAAEIERAKARGERGRHD